MDVADPSLPVRFLQKILDEGVSISFFSVPTTGVMQGNVKTRAFVTHEGMDDGAGKWACNRDRKAKNCPHINACRDLLQQIITHNYEAKDEGADRGPMVYNGEFLTWQRVIERSNGSVNRGCERRSRNCHTGIVHQDPPTDMVTHSIGSHLPAKCPSGFPT